MRRRTFLIAGICGAGLVSCGPPGPAEVTINATGLPGMNPSLDGRELPVTVAVYHLATPATFLGADARALQSDAATILGADLLKEEAIALIADQPVTSSITVEDGATALGFLAGFRDPGTKVTKQVIAVAPGNKLDLILTVGPAGLSVEPA